MFGFLFKKIFGSTNDRYLRKLRPLVQRINDLEPEMQQLEDADFPIRIAQYIKKYRKAFAILMLCCPKYLPWCAKPRYASWACATMMFSSLAAWCCTRARLPK